MIYNKKVIQLSSPQVWSFWDFEYAGGGNAIEEWVQDLSEGANNMFQDLLKNNRKIESPLQWIGFKRFLKGRYKKERIWELEFRSDKRQYRVLGVFGAVRKQAVLLIGCYHKDRVYTPTDALELAYQRAKAVSERRAIIRERTVRSSI